MPDYTNDGNRMTQEKLHKIMTGAVAKAINDGVNMDIVYGIVSAIHRKTEFFFDMNMKSMYKEITENDDA